MARPGDVVEFRSGLHGLDAPRNLGILVSRQRRKGVPWVRLMTAAGPLDVKQEHLNRRAFRARFEGDLRDEAALHARLASLLAQHAGGDLPEEQEDDIGALEEALWEATCDAGRDAWTDAEIAAAYYGEPSPLQMKQVRECLDRCRRPGTGRFETVAGRGDTWRPWTRGERDAMRASWEALGRLRQQLVRVDETEEGRVFRRVGLAEAGLDSEAHDTLGWASRAMAQFVEHDGVPDTGIAGIGGVGAVKAFGMDLHRQLGFLAADWIASEPTTRSSDYVHFLLETGRWGPDDAVAALVRRHVNQEPFFEHVPDAQAEAAAERLPAPSEEEAFGAHASEAERTGAGPAAADAARAGAGAQAGAGAPAGDGAREDLRHLECYTIDPPDAKDFDDAVGLEELEGGRQRLWVHIADVSHYVQPGSRLDKHAKDRATSVYLPGRVLPMLPRRLADDLCSLRDDGDRFALSVHLDVARDGSIEATGCHISFIRVTKNLSYGDALRARDAGQAPFPALFDLAKRMRGHRRGLELDTGELRVMLEESGFSALEKRADDATRMIETFMVAANEAVARTLHDASVPLLYRCHPLPDAAKAERFEHQMETMGYNVRIELPRGTGGTKESATTSLLDQLKAGGGKLQLFGGGIGLAQPAGPPDDPEDAEDSAAAETDQGFAALSHDEQEAWLAPFRQAVETLAAADDRARADVATLKLLACMGQAYYTPQNQGHFGLGSTHYCHFTSPIRRYPDLVVHRNLKAHLRGQALPHPMEDLDRMCDHCSAQERAAAGLERRIRSACLVLASLAGEQQAPARITGITPASLFVRRGDGIEARAAARDLPGGPYSVDEWESMLFVSDREAPLRFAADELRAWRDWYDEGLGERRRVRARLGDPVSIRLTGRDVADGKTGAQIAAWTG